MNSYISKDKLIEIPISDLENYLLKKTSELCEDNEVNECIVEKIVLAEIMHVPTHGLHYYIHAVHPLLQRNREIKGSYEIHGSIVKYEGTRGVGFLNLQNALDVTSKVAESNGCGILVMKNPGKVGALRVFIERITKRNQLVIMMKNTAKTVGIKQIGSAFFGTNPLAIGLPGSQFIYDSSISTIATNKVRLSNKYASKFDTTIGVDENQNYTSKPEDIITPGGYLLPFSFGPYWYKSFFLGVAIDAISAFSGGKTGNRVGDHKGDRYDSEEGLMAILIDSSASFNYENYLAELNLMLDELKNYMIKLPGEHEKKQKTIKVLKDDWSKLIRL